MAKIETVTSTVTLEREDYLTLLGSVREAYQYFATLRDTQIAKWREDPAREAEIMPLAVERVKKKYESRWRGRWWPYDYEYTTVEVVTPGFFGRLFGRKPYERKKVTQKTATTLEEYIAHKQSKLGYTSIEDEAAKQVAAMEGKPSVDVLIALDSRLNKNIYNPFPHKVQEMEVTIDRVSRAGDKPIFNIPRAEYDVYANALVCLERGELPHTDGGWWFDELDYEIDID